MLSLLTRDQQIKSQSCLKDLERILGELLLLHQLTVTTRVLVVATLHDRWSRVECYCGPKDTQLYLYLVYANFLDTILTHPRSSVCVRSSPSSLACGKMALFGNAEAQLYVHGINWDVFDTQWTAVQAVPTLRTSSTGRSRVLIMETQ